MPTPVPSYLWALGNASGAALVALLTTALLFASAALGVQLRGAPATYATTRIAAEGTRWLPLPPIRVPEGATLLRLMIHADLLGEARVGLPAAPTLEVDGAAYLVPPDRPITVPIRSERVQIRNLTPEFRVRLVLAEVRAFGERRSFLANALFAALPPALGAGAIAALAVAASAHLSAAVAALLALLILSLASMKGFLSETLEYQGAAHRAASAEGHGEIPESSVRQAARALLKTTLGALPDLSHLDRSPEVGHGEWVGVRRVPSALSLIGICLCLGMLFGSLGMRLGRVR